MKNEKSDYLQKLLTSAKLREPALRSAIEALELPRGSRGLDVGCGAGLQCLLLAQALGPQGQVTGVDVEQEFLEHGRLLVEREGRSEQIALRQGSAEHLPFEEGSFDWVWSADCVGYGPWDPEPMLREMARVLRPGGKLAILAWSSEKLLPGFPLLEARLQATKAGLSPFRPQMGPARHFPRSLGVLRGLGLTDLQAHTCVGTAHAPLDGDRRSALESLFEMRWPDVEAELCPDDLSLLQRLIRPSSEEFILDHPDYYAFFTYSVFWGRLC